MQRLAGHLVPDDGGFTLVADADGFDQGRVDVEGAQLFDGALHAHHHRLQQLVRVGLGPAALRSQLAHLHLVVGYQLSVLGRKHLQMARHSTFFEFLFFQHQTKSAMVL